MKNLATLCVIFAASAIAASPSSSAENLLEKCLKWYPNRVDWCERQYAGDDNKGASETSGKSVKELSNSRSLDEKSVQRQLMGREGRSGEIEAISAISELSNKTLLFVLMKRSGNVLCPADGPSWVLAEKDGIYYAINGTARSWSTNMKIYRSGKWYKVEDGGVGPDSAFGVGRTSDLIKIGNELCPSLPGKFLDRMAERIDFGEEQARRFGHKYGLYSTSKAPYGCSNKHLLYFS